MILLVWVWIVAAYFVLGVPWYLLAVLFLLTTLVDWK